MERDWELARPPEVWPDVVVREVAGAVVGGVGAVGRLSGGRANACWRVEAADGPVVVRAWTRDPSRAEVECALLAEVASRVPVPRVLHRAVVADVPVAVLSWVPGQALAEVVSSLSSDDARAVFEDAGRVLRAIQDQGYPTPGMLGVRGDHVDVVQPLAGVGEVWRSYLASVLFDGGGGAVLGDDRLARLWSAVGTFSPVLDAEVDIVLCHADFKPENLKVAAGPHGWRVTGVLDWEFAWASSPWFDAGQLLRWEHALPEGVADAFGGGWQRFPGERPADWRLRARLLDLMNLCGFLHRLAGPVMRAEIVALIDRHLAALPR